MLNLILLTIACFSFVSLLLFIAKWGFYLLWLPGKVLYKILQAFQKYPVVTVISFAVGGIAVAVALHYASPTEYLGALFTSVSGSMFSLLRILVKRYIK